jgi:prophage antirepressor-like protein
MLCSAAVGHQHFRGPCYLQLQSEVNGAGKEDTDTGREYNMGYSLEANRKQERIAILTERGVYLWCTRSATTGTNRLARWCTRQATTGRKHWAEN